MYAADHVYLGNIIGKFIQAISFDLLQVHGPCSRFEIITPAVRTKFAVVYADIAGFEMEILVVPYSLAVQFLPDGGCHAGQNIDVRRAVEPYCFVCIYPFYHFIIGLHGK
ncbi:hypothetical protein SDC9_70123 [bioreactor metagenome]|uniref:Uncharacterized protein n=1 Tax=bioreactor metagenome TaxID=1076179 RepID=A0A644Y5S0_9ZZZZ